MPVKRKRPVPVAGLASTRSRRVGRQTQETSSPMDSPDQVQSQGQLLAEPKQDANSVLDKADEDDDSSIAKRTRRAQALALASVSVPIMTVAPCEDDNTKTTDSGSAESDPSSLQVPKTRSTTSALKRTRRSPRGHQPSIHDTLVFAVEEGSEELDPPRHEEEDELDDEDGAPVSKKPRRSPRDHEHSANGSLALTIMDESRDPDFQNVKGQDELDEDDEPPVSRKSRRLPRGHLREIQQEPNADVSKPEVSEIDKPEKPAGDAALKKPRRLAKGPRPQADPAPPSEEEYKPEVADENDGDDEDEDEPIAKEAPIIIKATKATKPRSKPSKPRPRPSSTDTSKTVPSHPHGQLITKYPDLDINIPELVHSRPYSGSIRARSQLATHLPPLYKLDDIFKSLTDRAIQLNLDDVLKHLGDRKLRVVTMCSGTESPLLALEMVRKNLQTHFNRDLNFKHLFSAEIVPFKQAYIERNFHPRLMFRDVAELKNRVAQTAYGSLAKIPKNADILIAGFACVDFSPLNNHRKALSDLGESGDTFWGIHSHAKIYRPRLVILENVKGAPWTTIAQHWNDIDYFAVHADVDTKAYYLPQTRERGYMFCVDKRLLDQAGLDEEEMGEWATLLAQFRRPASSPAGMFLLDADDRRLEQIEKNMDLRIAGQSSGKAAINWDRYQVRHQAYRLTMGLGHRRPISKSQDDGTCRMPDFAWQNWVSSLPERVWDTIDMNFLRKLLDGYDMNYKERFLELSQGIDREMDSRAYGIVGCLTPTGMPYMTTRGGPVCGLESLSLQGLPLDRLLLTQESQKELQDLAGNAMSSTAVGAAILSALIVGHKVLKKNDSSHPLKSNGPKSKNIAPRGDLGYELLPCSMDMDEYDIDQIAELQEQVGSSASCCICEGQSSIRAAILKCRLCSHTACSECVGNPQHDYERWTGLERTAPLDFMSLFQSILPARLVVTGITQDSYKILQCSTSIPSEIWSDFLDAVFRALDEELRFLEIKRSEVWTALYEGEHALLKVIIESGAITWLLFAKPLETEPALSLTREVLSQPIARMVVPPSNSSLSGNWEICAPLSFSCSLKLSGSGSRTQSYEAKCGLEKEGFKDSQVWTQITVQGDDEEANKLEVDLRGTYTLLQDCGTANACLHRRPPTDGKPAVFLFLDPTKLGEPQNDSFVFAWKHTRQPGYSKRLSIAEISHDWRSSKVTDKVELVSVYCRKWIACPTISMCSCAEEFNNSVDSYSFDTRVSIPIGHGECQNANVTLLAFTVPKTLISFAGVTTEWGITDPVDSPQILRECAWLFQKAVRYSDYQRWIGVVKPYSNHPCRICVPSKPEIRWGRDRKGRIKAYEDPYGAARYEREIKSRPLPFLIFRRVTAHDFAELRVTLNIQTLLHQAHGRLPDSRNASFHWRLVPNSNEIRDIPFPQFNLRSNRNDDPSSQPLRFLLQLRPEQLRSLGWMIDQESGVIQPFIQEETEEALLSSLMWRAEGKITVPKIVRGGILADDVGYGKTAIVLGLIDANSNHFMFNRPTFPNDDDFDDSKPNKSTSEDSDSDKSKRKNSRPLNDSGFIPSRATLIVVPRIMVQQWKSEIEKFLGKKPKVLSFASAAALKKTSIQDMKDCDIVLVSWAVFDTSAYYQHLKKCTGASKAPDDPGRNFDEWFSHAHDLMKDHLRVLTQEGPRAYMESLRKSQTWNSREDDKYVPSKRLRGKQYVLAKQKQNHGVKTVEVYADLSSAEEESDLEYERDSKALEAKVERLLELVPPTASGEETKKTEDQKSQKGRTGVDWKEFGVARNGDNQCWETVTGLPFHAFHFQRLVIDEFTYAKADRLNQLLALQAHSRWVLSGTPPLNDFADVNTIAPFLEVHLGIDADDDVSPSNSRLKDLRKLRSEAENFESFRAPRSEAWHRRRHEVAQNFLDRFARRNIAEIDEIPSTEHIILVRQSPAEMAIYLELYKQIMQYNGQLRRTNSRGFDSDQAERLDEIIKLSLTLEEALIKRCTSLAGQGRWNNGEPEAATCALLITTREKQLEKLKDELKTKLKLAAWVYCTCDKNNEIFDNFSNAIQGDFGDMSVADEVYPLLTTAISTSVSDDWKLFFANPDAKDGDEEAGTPLPPKPTKMLELEPILRRATTAIRKLVVEWVCRTRALRFLKAVRQIQTNPQTIPCCDGCATQPGALAKINILGSCGHAICPNCTQMTMQNEVCAVEECRGSGKQFNVINALTLAGDTSDSNVSNGQGSKTDLDASSRFGGTKLDALVDLIRTRIPYSDRALLFIQFPDLMDIASRALGLAGIQHTAITSTDRTGAQKVEKFQKAGFGTNKVLLLNLGSEMAAGLNLQCANHIIFLSPFFAQTQYDYESTMVQAVGRCRRYGQTKHVHIYHLLAKTTIDVNIFQERRGKTLVERDGKPILVNTNEVLDSEKLTCQGPEMVV